MMPADKIIGSVRAFLEADTSVNAYLINTGSKLVLVDAGGTKAFIPTLGSVLKNLRSSGYEPSQVDAVVITHLHGDHMGGLLDDKGKPVLQTLIFMFPKQKAIFTYLRQ
jgi:glyoxylase-like metal-dependent hydrolase (beta-lactamase superfamily II)